MDDFDNFKKLTSNVIKCVLCPSFCLEKRSIQQVWAQHPKIRMLSLLSRKRRRKGTDSSGTITALLPNNSISKMAIGSMGVLKKNMLCGDKK
jgi:hypothetical protein